MEFWSKGGAALMHTSQRDLARSCAVKSESPERQVSKSGTEVGVLGIRSPATAKPLPKEARPFIGEEVTTPLLAISSGEARTRLRIRQLLTHVVVSLSGVT
ncbi:hypothetical protein AVEN_108575-1 [Araneus ventricosus]|uniref:Uncharacterized protein n=1 Tax=Araneus ventricosus TaxID=182803 RepID=A0A4Y2DIX1_ARAVE|nr:hypothetical protein AVEN_108575-1 [Araneus ventricosus]